MSPCHALKCIWLIIDDLTKKAFSIFFDDRWWKLANHEILVEASAILNGNPKYTVTFRHRDQSLRPTSWKSRQSMSNFKTKFWNWNIVCSIIFQRTHLWPQMLVFLQHSRLLWRRGIFCHLYHNQPNTFSLYQDILMPCHHTSHEGSQYSVYCL